MRLIHTWLLLACIAMLLSPSTLSAQEAGQTETKVVLLGSGNPNPDPDHAGPAVAGVVGDHAYLFDAGTGIVRSAARMSPRYGGAYPALAARRLTRVFLTHLHSDHTIGLADLMLTPWVMGRDEALQLYGPEGSAAMVAHLQDAYREDIHYRLFGEEPANNQGWRVDVHEISGGVVYRDSLVTVEAFQVPHGSWPVSLAYRVRSADRTIVISGDTRPSDVIERIARDGDLLVHEVYYAKGLEDRRRSQWQHYHRAHHTSTHELGRIASAARPRLVVLYHILFWGATDEDLLAEIRSEYDGAVVVGEDGGVY